MTVQNTLDQTGFTVIRKLQTPIATTTVRKTTKGVAADRAVMDPAALDGLTCPRLPMHVVQTLWGAQMFVTDPLHGSFALFAHMGGLLLCACVGVL